MAETISLKSKSTGLVGSYPVSHLGMDDDLVPVDADGNICLPCMGGAATVEDETPVAVSDPKPGPRVQAKNDKEKDE